MTKSRKVGSLRRRVALATLAVFTAVFSVGAFFTWLALARQFETCFKEDVNHRLTLVAACVEWENGHLKWTGPELDREDGLRYQIRSTEGKTLAGDDSLDDGALGQLTPGTLTQPTYQDFRLGADDGIAASAIFNAEKDGDSKGHELAVLIFISRAGQASEQQAAIWIPLFAALGSGSLGLALLLPILNRLFAPHLRLAEAIADLDGREHPTPLRIQGLPSELAPVVANLNLLLKRLERTYALAQSFSAAAAHELRTPIAGLRVTTEVALAGNDPKTALGVILGITCRMQVLVDNLIQVARVDTGQIRAEIDEVDLLAILDEGLAETAQALAARNIRPVWSQREPAFPLGDAGLLRIIVRNLLDNAAEHADQGAELELSCTSGKGVVRLIVNNPAQHLDPRLIVDLGRRHWARSAPSKSGARPTTSRHIGLGMYLIRELTAKMGGAMSIQGVGGRFHLGIELPAAPTAD